MSNAKCEWCENSFTTSTILKTHQRTAKYCLALQGKVDVKGCTCDVCGKNFTLSSSLRRHSISCQKKASNTDEINRLREENARLKAKCKSLKSEVAEYKSAVREEKKYAVGIERGVQITPARSQTVNIHPKLINIPIDNIRPFTIDTVREEIDAGKFTENMFRKGVVGLVDFVSNIISFEAEDGTTHINYACTDSSRNRFHRLLESKEWQEDNGAHFLNNVLDQLQTPVTEIYSDFLDKKRYADNDVDRDYYTRVVEETEPIYQGVKFNGRDRRKLFSNLRNEIRSVASV